jgi:hypothetical protein
MTADRDITRVVRSWLEEGVTALPDRVLDVVLHQLPATPQRQPLWRAWRPSVMSSMVRVAIVAAAAVIVVAVGLTVLQTPGRRGGPLSSPSPTPTAQPTLLPAPSGPVDILGLPPEGAVASDSAPGELVLRFDGTTGSPGLITSPSSGSTIWVYADGRLIWNRFRYVPPNAGDAFIGLLQQRLTKSGVEFLRSEVIATGLFASDLAVARETSGFLQIEVRNGERLVRATWAARTNRFVGQAAPPATSEQESALTELGALLNDSTSWPATAWSDRTMRAYVPGRFAIRLRGVPDPIEPAQALGLLPQAAQDLYRAGDPASGASVLTTEDARALAEILERAPIQRSDPESGAFWLRYVLPDQPTSGNDVWISFEPVRPDGESAWLGPG